MTISEREKRALLLLIPAIAFVLLFRAFSGGSGDGSVGRSAADSVQMAEMQLRKMRVLAASLPSRQQSNQQAKADLDLREKSLINASDEKLAQERLLDIVQKLAQSQAPPLNILSKELGQPKPFGDYGEVSVTLNLVCRIEQMVNFLSDLTAQPEAVATEELHVSATNPESKEMQIRVTIGGLIPRRLLPKKKETTEF